MYHNYVYAGAFAVVHIPNCIRKSTTSKCPNHPNKPIEGSDKFCSWCGSPLKEISVDRLIHPSFYDVFPTVSQLRVLNAPRTWDFAVERPGFGAELNDQSPQMLMPMQGKFLTSDEIILLGRKPAPSTGVMPYDDRKLLPPDSSISLMTFDPDFFTHCIDNFKKNCESDLTQIGIIADHLEFRCGVFECSFKGVGTC